MSKVDDLMDENDRLVEESIGDDESNDDISIGWSLTKRLIALGTGLAATSVVRDALANNLRQPSSIFAKLVYAVGLAGIGGLVGTAVSRYTEEDLGGFDEAVKIIRAYRKEQ